MIKRFFYDHPILDGCVGLALSALFCFEAADLLVRIMKAAGFIEAPIALHTVFDLYAFTIGQLTLTEVMLVPIVFRMASILLPYALGLWLLRNTILKLKRMICLHLFRSGVASLRSTYFQYASLHSA